MTGPNSKLIEAVGAHRADLRREPTSDDGTRECSCWSAPASFAGAAGHGTGPHLARSTSNFGAGMVAPLEAGQWV